MHDSLLSRKGKKGVCLPVCGSSQVQFLGSGLSSAGRPGPRAAAGTEEVGRYVIRRSWTNNSEANRKRGEILHALALAKN